MTRQWLADPDKMCMSHIAGEHAEAHGFMTKMHREISLDGFIEGSMFFGAEYVKYRHDLLMVHLPNHTTPLELDDKVVRDYPLVMPTMDDLKTSLGTLLSRCNDCLLKHQGK